MPFFDSNRIELSPCIVSKAKQALNLTPINGRINQTKCSEQYWRRVVYAVGNSYGVPWDIMQDAIDEYMQYCT